jgi:hypothetical protein
VTRTSDEIVSYQDKQYSPRRFQPHPAKDEEEQRGLLGEPVTEAVITVPPISMTHSAKRPRMREKSPDSM